MLDAKKNEDKKKIIQLINGLGLVDDRSNNHKDSNRLTEPGARARDQQFVRQGFCIETSLHRRGWIVAWAGKGTLGFVWTECRSRRRRATVET